MKFFTSPCPNHVGMTKVLLAALLIEFYVHAEAVAQSFWEPIRWPRLRTVKSLILDSQGKIVAGADSGWVLFSSDDGESWTNVAIGSGESVRALAVNDSGHIFAGTAGSGIFRSTDNGKTWIAINQGLGHHYIHSLAIISTEHIFAGTEGGGVFRSIDNGQLWEAANNGLKDGFVLTIAVNDTSGYIFAGTNGAGVCRSKDEGKNWTPANNGLTSSDIWSLTINEEEKYILAGTGEGIFRSNNDGERWVRIDKGLDNTEINCLDLPRHRTGYIFAGTNGGGVYRSINNGRDWLPVNTGLTKNSIWVVRSNASGRMFVGELDAGVLRSKDAALPSITHAAPDSSPQPSNTKLFIDAQITDDTGIDSVFLYYRQGGESTFSSAILDSDATNHYSGFIPEGVVNSRGVEYYLFAKDIFGNFAQKPLDGFFSVQVKTSGETSPTLPHGSEQSAYRLFSVPLDLDNKNPKTVFEDDLESYDIKKWRFFEFGVDQSSHELSDKMKMVPGKAYWLIVKQAGKVIHTGPGTSNKTDEEYIIPLHPKWNYIGNPFNFSIAVDSIHLSLKSGNQFELRTFAGRWIDPNSTPVTAILPFEGYAIFVDAPDILLINPNLSSNSKSSLFKATALSWANQTFWSIRILVRCQEASDVDNIAAIVASASHSWDELDKPEPPVIGEYVSLSFPHREWGKLATKYCTDVRPEPTDGEVWEFEVKTNISDKVNLSFEGIESVPEENEIWLIDEVVPVAQNLRQNQSYVVAASSPEHPKRLKLVVGKRDFAEEKIANTQAIPTTYELNQNFPNPFNPATTIRYGLPQAERVTLKIYNLLGEEVVTLLDNEPQAAGYHVAIWDGRNKLGEVIGSGVYLLRFHVGSFSSIKKMALVK